MASVVIAFPFAYFAARYARGKWKALFYILVMLPLWSSYLVKVYAWKLILAKEGIISWLAAELHLTWALDALLAIPVIGGPSLSISFLGTFIVFVYVWLPFMILPTQAALERVPVNLIDASSDLGATPAQTFRNVIFPLALPGIIAGSIFTFSLTLGDYIIPQIIGNSSYFLGQTVYTLQGTAGNIPLAAAFTVVPIVIMGIYLAVAKKNGSLRCALRAPPSPEDRRPRLRGLSPCAAAADIPLCLHHGGKELPVPAARLHHEMVRRRLGTPGHLGCHRPFRESGRHRDLAGPHPRHLCRRGRIARQILRP